MTKPLDIMMVERRPEFWPMAASNWLKSSVEPWRPGGDVRVWRTYEHALVERAWKDPGMVWLFAADPTDTNFVHGWLCGEHTDAGPIIHYLYVRKRMRNSRALYLGVADALFETFMTGVTADRITHSRTTAAGEAWAARQVTTTGTPKYEWFYNPYMMFREFRPDRPKGRR